MMLVARLAKSGGKGRAVRWLGAMLLGAAVCSSGACAAGDRSSLTADANMSTVHGVVRDAAGKPVPGVDVRLERKDGWSSKDGTTAADGLFELQVPGGDYVLTAQKAGWRSRRVEVTVEPAKDGNQSGVSLEIVLEPEGSTHQTSDAKHANSPQQMEFSDSPSFTIAAVTDWTAAGGHGSDNTSRNSGS